MQITELDIRNFKTLTAVIPIKKLNLFVGPIGSGKSAALQALHFGVSPKGERAGAIGSSPTDYWPWVTDHAGCSVKVTLDDRFSWTRGLRMDHEKGSVSQSLRIAGDSRTGSNQLDAAVKAHVGELVEMFKLATFIDISPERQRNRIMDLIGATQGQADPATLCRRVTRGFLADEQYLGATAVALSERQAERTADELTAFLLDQLAKPDRQAFERIMSELRAEATGTMTDSLRQMLRRANEIRNGSKTEAEKAHGAIERLERQRAGVTVPAETVVILKARRVDLLKQRESVTGRIERKRARDEQAETIVKRLEEIDGRIDRARAKLAALNLEAVPKDDDAAQLSTEAANLESQPMPWPAGVPTADEVLALSHKLGEANAAVATARAANQAAFKRLNEIQSRYTEIATLRQSLADLEARPVPTQDSIDAMERLVNAEEDARSSAMLRSNMTAAITELEIRHDTLADNPWLECKRLAQLIEASIIPPLDNMTFPATIKDLLDFIDARCGTADEVLASLKRDIELRRAQLAEIPDSGKTSLQHQSEWIRLTEQVRNARTLADSHATRVSGIREALAKLGPETVEAELAAAREADTECQTAEELATKQQKEIEAAYQTAERASRTATEGQAQAGREHRQKVADLRQTAETIRSTIDMHVRAVETTERDLRAAMTERQTAANELPQFNADDQTDRPLADVHAELTTDIAAVDAAIELRESAATLDTEILKTVAAAKLELVRHKVATACWKAIKGIRDGLMSEMVNPLLAHIDRFIRKAKPGYRGYCELERQRGEEVREVFEFGWTDGRARTPITGLSDGQWGLFGPALVYAIVMAANPPLKVLSIEADSMRGQDLRRLFDALEDVAPDVSNIMVATCFEDVESMVDPLVWNVVDVEMLKAVTADAVF